MGSHSKKHKKTRRRSCSRSPSSDYRHHKSSRKSRSRSPSSDSSYRRKRTKSKKHRRRSSSDSRSRSPVERRRHYRSRSRSREYEPSRRRQRSRSYTRRSRSRTPTRRRRRSRSGSLSTSQSSLSTSRHQSKETVQPEPHTVTADTIKQKMRKALEAVASANEKVKEMESPGHKHEPSSISDVRDRQLTIADIEQDDFKSSTFVSSHVTGGSKPAKLSKEQNHDNAMFGGAGVNIATMNRSSYLRNKQIIFYKTINRGELASAMLCKSTDDRMQAWVEKLQKMRQDRLASHPEYFKKLIRINESSEA